MYRVVCLILVFGFPAVSSMLEGRSDDTEWAFQWYIGEPFRFECNTTQLNISSVNDIQVVWDTPVTKGIRASYDDQHFKTMNSVNGYNAELLVKNVQPSLHGVYMCHVYDKGSQNLEGKIVYGLNIHEPKYHEAIDRYRHNIIVAFVATAVFVVPLATTCFVWKFQYKSPEDKERLSERKRNQKHMYNGSDGTEMKQRAPEGIASFVEAPEGQGAYENPNTRL